MAEKNSSGAAANERTIVITRIFDAPRELVFKAWTEAAHLAQWWGPKGFTNPVCKVDARPGGALRIVMRAPDGAEHPMTGVFREVTAPARLVFTSVAVDRDGKPLLEGLTTVTFADQGGKTKLHRGKPRRRSGRLCRAHARGDGSRVDAKHRSAGRACRRHAHRRLIRAVAPPTR